MHWKAWALFVVVALTSSALLSSCGRQWCVAGMGPCELQQNGGPGTDTGTRVQCGRVAGTTFPRNGLTLYINGINPATMPTFVVNGPAARLSAAGGVASATYTYMIKSSNGSGQINIDSFVARAPGYVCLKVTDGTFGVNDSCDFCEREVQVLPAP